MRDIDVLARLGSDEFVLLSYQADARETRAIIDRFHRALAGAPLRVGDVSLRLTISVGIAPHAPGMSLDALLARADTALYQAKMAGRDSTRMA